jgi:CheY-like chemotaxis protein
MGNEPFAQLFDANPLPSVLLRRDDLVLVAVNTAYVETFGWCRDEVVGRCARDVEWAAGPREQAALISQIENRDLVDDIDAAVTRAFALTRQLLAFSRKQVVEPKVLDLNMTVNETRKMLRRLVGEDIVLTTSLEPDLGRVRADPGYLVQVLMNLAVNAREAMPRGGTLSITTRNVAITAEHASRHLRVRAGAGVMIEVADSGAGMSPDVIAHIFEPFFTTKAYGKGTGMGLAVVHGIVEQAGGFIEVESELGVGTTFRVYLPVVDAQVDAAADIAAAIALGSETILVVDDDVRRSAARALRARGYHVIEAGSGALALEQLAAGTRVDLLLTDVVMPGMDGRQLAEAARALSRPARALHQRLHRRPGRVPRRDARRGRPDRSRRRSSAPACRRAPRPRWRRPASSRSCAAPREMPPKQFAACAGAERRRRLQAWQPSTPTPRHRVGSQSSHHTWRQSSQSQVSGWVRWKIRLCGSSGHL